jgi:hypothetical protein
MGESMRPVDAGQASGKMRNPIPTKTIDDRSGSRQNSNRGWMCQTRDSGIPHGQEEKLTCRLGFGVQ